MGIGICQGQCFQLFVVDGTQSFWIFQKFYESFLRHFSSVVISSVVIRHFVIGSAAVGLADKPNSGRANDEMTIFAHQSLKAALNTSSSNWGKMVSVRSWF